MEPNIASVYTLHVVYESQYMESNIASINGPTSRRKKNNGLYPSTQQLCHVCEG